MKTVLDKVPLHVAEGKSITIPLPEPFRPSDGLFLLVHNSLGEAVTLTLEKEGRDPLIQRFTLAAFPAILVFPAKTSRSATGIDALGYDRVTIASFHELTGSLTFRSKNPPHILAAYQP